MEKIPLYMNIMTKNDFFCYFKEGEMLFATEQYNAAIISLNKVINKLDNLNKLQKQKNIELISLSYKYIGMAYEKIGSRKIALKKMLTGIKEISKTEIKNEVVKDILTQLYNAIGSLYYENKNYRKAIKYYKCSFKKTNNILVRFMLASSQLNYGLFINAKDNYEIIMKKIEKFPGDKLLVYYDIIKTFTHLGKDEEALKYLIEASSIELKFYRSYGWSKNKDFINKNVKDEFFKYLERRYLENDKKNIDLVCMIIYMSFLIDKYNKAETYLAILKDNFPSDEETYYWRIIMNLKNGMYEEAKNIFNEVVQKEPDFVDNYNWLEVNINKNEIKIISEMK